MSALVLTLPIPPSGNRAARTGRGRHYTSPAVEAYRKEVWAEICRCYLVRPDLQPPFSLTVTLYLATLTRVDGDNAVKTISDAICLPLGLDDGLIVEYHAYKRQLTKREARKKLARCEVELRSLAPAPAAG